MLNAAMAGVRRVPAKTTLIHDGSSAGTLYVVLDGFAAASKILPSGRRSITAFLVPGDLCGLWVTTPMRVDHAVTTITATSVAEIQQDVLGSLWARPHLAQSLLWTMLVDASIMRAWLVSMGQRRAIEQMAHLFCELYYRLKTVGLSKGRTYPLPVTHEELADALGMTSVHISRTLQRLREEGLVEFKDRIVFILDLERLQKLAQFNANYLHLKPAANAGKKTSMAMDVKTRSDAP